jgi:hypothetical protein
MKKYILVFALLSILVSCKKDDPEPEPETPDYADGLVVTYVGTETRYQQDNWTVDYTNSSKTMVITKLEKNRIKLTSFDAGYSPTFKVTERSDGNITLTPENFTPNGTSTYFNSSKQLGTSITTGVASTTRYHHYSAVKQ